MGRNEERMSCSREELLFSDSKADSLHSSEQSSDDSNNIGKTWKVLIVDDEVAIHDITTLSLKHFTFQSRHLEFYHAYSGEQAKQVLRDEKDLAVVLLDVVMENDKAGLDVVKFIRDDIQNHFIRIILRTGQPGVAPENEVVEQYDINDYKDKTELTIQKLSTSMFTALRSYRDLMALNCHRAGLEKVINASASIYKVHDLSVFVSGLLQQLISVVGSEQDSFCTEISGFVCGCDVPNSEDRLSEVSYGTGSFANAAHKSFGELVSDKTMERLKEAIRKKTSLYFEDESIFIVQNKQGDYGLIYLAHDCQSDSSRHQLVELFSSNISIVYENLSLYKELDDTQSEIIFTLGTVAEFRSNETAAHVERVGRYSQLLALKYGLDVKEARLIKMASPLHDIGKIGIPDEILNKPGKLTAEEMDIMKQHCVIGYDMLKHSKRSILKAAATIAHEHQEKWDGSGYPLALSGEAIHIYGRIVALADVFDALGSDRCYKKAWSLEKIIDYFKEQKGLHFQPQLVDIFLENLDEFLVIRDKFKV